MTFSPSPPNAEKHLRQVDPIKLLLISFFMYGVYTLTYPNLIPAQVLIH